MNKRIKELAEQSREKKYDYGARGGESHYICVLNEQKFAESIVKEMCGLMEQAEDDAYHCFEPGEQPTEYIEWLRDWQERFAKHFGVE